MPQSRLIEILPQFWRRTKDAFFCTTGPSSASTAKGQAKPVPTLKPVKDIFVSLLQMFDSVAEAVAAAGLDQD